MLGFGVPARVIAAVLPALVACDVPELVEVATGLAFREGAIAMVDGSSTRVELFGRPGTALLWTTWARPGAVLHHLDV